MKVGIIALAAFLVSLPAAHAAEVIVLTQAPCQFIEIEGTDYGFKSAKKADCQAINKKTSAERLAKSKVLELKPGDYIFRVTNRDVPYELGFWLRDIDYDWRNPLHRLTKTSVSGGGIQLGQTKDFPVTLKPGTYLYKCPLNPTPDYKLIVSGG